MTWKPTAAPTAQVWSVELDMAVPFRVYGSIQDHFSVQRTIDRTKPLSPEPFGPVQGSETTSHASDPAQADLFYTSRQLMGRDLVRVTWERVSGDLTGPPRPDLRRPDFGVQAITAIAESPLDRDVVYAGTDDGLLHVTIDGGKSWTNLTPRLPRSGWVTSIVPSRHQRGSVYVTVNGRENDDFGAYLYGSRNQGGDFRSIVANIPAGPVNVVREDPSIAGVLYAGTDFGVYVSSNGGETWSVLGSGLPSVPVMDLQVHPRDRILVIATWGAGLWGLNVPVRGTDSSSAAAPDVRTARSTSR
jgi:hypothetical protein